MPRTQRHLGYRLAVAGLVFIALLTLIPDPGATDRAALTPVYCIVCGDVGGVDFLLNIFLFVPFGIGLAVAGFSWRRALVLAGLVSFSVELLQMKVIAGRDASLGDVFTNTLGGGLGAFIGAEWRRFVFPGPNAARRMALVWALTLGWIWAGTAWAFGPTWPVGAPWYGQWAADLGHMKPFLGKPLSITAGGDPLLPGRALDQSRLEDAIAANPSMTFRAVLGPRPTRLAPVGSIYDGWKHEVILLGQERQDLSFRYRMRATILKLQNPRANLQSGMAGQPGDTVIAEGALRAGTFELRSRMHGRELTRRLALSASWGWSLVTPWNSVLGEEVRSLTALWIVGLVALLAYWSGLAGGAALSIVPITVAGLLGAVPYAAGFPPAHWSEWAAALAGTALGAVASNAARRRIAAEEAAG